ncbi:MAG: DUF86 domain-containing protein [Candidatus Saccharibacteria bacterium]|nr:DUF86 domain-containing protein [Candidatus Saccharibacteria bacterium]
MEPSDKLHLENILSFCDDINSAIDELSIDYDAFYESTAKRGALAFFVMQIGEEAGKLSKTFRESQTEMDWPAITNFRNHIAHGYIGVIPDVLWDTVQSDIPELRDFCAKQIGKN